MKHLLLILAIIASFFILISPAQAFVGEVPGTFELMVEGANKQMCSDCVSDHVEAVISCDNPASAEMTTVGCLEENAPISGVLPDMSNNLASIISTKPVSSNEYLADVMNNIGLPVTQPAYAQFSGVGFNALNPVLPLWKAFRNVAYLVYVIILVVIGFMIMFRQKIDPQTVISVQAALPRIVITLILITFSYAIAGFLIDLIYVGIYIPAYIMTPEVFEDAGNVVNILLNNNLFTIVFPFGEEDTFARNASDAAGLVVSNIIGDAVGTILSMAVEGFTRLLFSIILLISMIKLFLTLGIGFIKIILSVVFAPIQIMFNAIPGSQAFTKWFRALLANVAMFPAVAVLFMVGAALIGPDAESESNRWGVVEDIGYSSQELDDSVGWIPPFLIMRDNSLNAEGTPSSVNPILALVGFFIFVISPQVATMTRDFLKVEEKPYGQAIGQAAGQAGGYLGMPISYLRQQREQATQSDRQARSFAKYTK